MAWASTHTWPHCLNNCLHSVERHSTAPMLLSCWSDSLGSIPKGSLSIFQLYCLAVPCLLYHENTRLGASSISRHKARSGGFGTRIRGVWSSNPTRDNAALATVDRNQMEGQLLSSVKCSTTDSDTRCHVGSSLTLQVGPTPDRRGSLRMQLPRRRPTWTWNPGSTPSSPAGGPRLDFKSGLVGLGKDASAPTSTDRIASHQRTRSPSMAQLRRQEKTPGNRDLTPALSHQLRRLGRGTHRPPLARMHWRLRHPKHGDDQLSNPLRPLAAAAAAPGDDRQAAHHQGAACRGKGYGLSRSGPPSSKGHTWRHEAQSSTPEARREEARLTFLPTVRSIRAGMGRRRRLRSRVSTRTAGPAANGGPQRNRVTQGLLHVPGTPSIKEINPVSILRPSHLGPGPAPGPD